MTLDASKTVREFATEFPNATRIFEKLGIDYCCGGNRPLRDACLQARIPLESVLRSLDDVAAPVEVSAEAKDFPNTSLSDLIAHICIVHHAYVKQEIPRLQQLLTKVVAVHCANHPELAAVQRTFGELSSELLSHMMKEEMVLFPYIEKLEEAVTQQSRAPRAPFGPISNPVHMMELEHESAGNALREIQMLTGGYTPPEGACFSYKTLYSALKGFEADLHQHIHLENNILFPRAVELESEEREALAARER
jgi:regulator of cell morphogenesis and NO signaling